MQANFKAVALDSSGHEFEIYKRQNLREGMEDDFSCGISWIAPNGETLTLKRYNGPNHGHLNNLEKERLVPQCLIYILQLRNTLKPTEKLKGLPQ